MADLAASAVTLDNSWSEGSVTGKRRLVKELTIVLTGQGDATDTIDAATLGLTKIEESTPAIVSDDSKIYLTRPSYDGSVLFLFDVEDSTDATRGNPTTVTGVTVRVTVKGY